jgi:pimeloyl-ACP methyl ester carboxylesterase
MARATSTAAKIGIGLAAAGAAAAAGAIAERRTRGGDLDTWVQPGGYDHTPDLETVVVTDDGIPLHVEIDEPDGPVSPGRPTVVFCHGFCLSSRSWVLQRRALADEGYRVVAWDQRSHGRSSEAPAESCTIEQLGRDLRAVIESTSPEGPLVLIGHSMGGMTIMSLADQYPDLVRARVVAAAFVGTSGGGQPMITLGFGPMVGRLLGRVGPGVLGRLGRYQERLNALRPLGRGVEDTFVARWSFDSPMSRETVEFAGDIIFATPFSVMSAFLPALEGHDKRESLAAFVGLEVLVLNGLGDLLTPPEHSEEIVRRIPGAEHVVVKDAGHLVMLEHPDLVTEQLALLVDRGMRAAAEDVEVERKPRVRRVLTDVARIRRGGRRSPEPTPRKRRVS